MRDSEERAEWEGLGKWEEEERRGVDGKWENGGGGGGGVGGCGKTDKKKGGKRPRCLEVLSPANETNLKSSCSYLNSVQPRAGVSKKKKVNLTPIDESCNIA